MPTTLDEQIGAVEAAMLGRDHPALADVLRTLQWLRRHRDVVIAARSIVKSPAVEAIREAFPGAELVCPDSEGDSSYEGDREN